METRWDRLAMAGKKRAAARDGFGAGLGIVGTRDPGLAGRIGAEVAELARTGLAPAPVVTGEDLIEMGLAPGPVFKRVLDGVYDAQLEGRVSGKDEGRRLAALLADQKGPMPGQGAAPKRGSELGPASGVEPG
jgi:poly(A) polymerase